MTTEVVPPNRIDQVMDRNWNAFESWRHVSPSQTTLDITDGAARVFIPRRILEMAQNPEAVDVLVTERGKNVNSSSGLGIIVYERTNDNISDPDKYKEWYDFWAKEPYSLDGTYSTPWNRDGVDYKHAHRSSLIQSGKLTLKDKIYFEYSADIVDEFPRMAKTRNFVDRPELHGQGIGTSFYGQLEKVLKAIGFDYLAGEIWSPKPAFFTKNRINANSLPEEVRSRLPQHLLKDNVFVRVL